MRVSQNEARTNNAIVLSAELSLWAGRAGGRPRLQLDVIHCETLYDDTVERCVSRSWENVIRGVLMHRTKCTYSSTTTENIMSVGVTGRPDLGGTVIDTFFSLVGYGKTYRFSVNVPLREWPSHNNELVHGKTSGHINDNISHVVAVVETARPCR